MIFINGDIIGFTTNPSELISTFKHNRNECIIHPHSSITWNIREYSIHIFTNRGRCIRPLIRACDIKNISLDQIISSSWDELILHNSFIEYIDTHEINNCILSTTSKTKNDFTHLEIHPCLILGALASCIPFLIIIKVREIHINLLWVNKLSVFIVPISIKDMIPSHMFSIIHKNLLSTPK